MGLYLGWVGIFSKYLVKRITTTRRANESIIIIIIIQWQLRVGARGARTPPPQFLPTENVENVQGSKNLQPKVLICVLH